MGVDAFDKRIGRVFFDGTEIFGSVEHYHNDVFQAQLFPSNLRYELTEDGKDKYYTVYGCWPHQLPKEVVIPATYQGIEVRYIGALGNQDYIDEFTYGGEVSRVQPSAFWGANLIKANLGRSTYLGNYAFAYNYYLQEVNSSICALGEGTFEGCEVSLETLTISREVESIPKDCFLNCNSLKKIVFTGDEWEWFDLMRTRGEGNDILDRVEVDYHVHSFGEYVTVVEPGCETTGSRERYCQCGAKEVESIPSKGGHKWGEWSITLPPTCVTKGEQIRYCTACDQSRKQELGTVEHTYAAANCIKPQHCIVEGCGHTVGGLADHQWGDPIIDTATQTEYRICKICETQENPTPLPFIYTEINTGSNAGTYSVKAGRSLKGDILIPSKCPYDGKAVTEIAKDGFAHNSNIISVIIPDSISIIRDGAFWGCDNLTSVVIGKGVVTIEQYAFLTCSSLKCIYYNGTADDWSNIQVTTTGNSAIVGATRYYYSEEEPTEEGNYWHWSEDNKPVSWHTHNYEDGMCTDCGFIMPTPNEHFVFRKLLGADGTELEEYSVEAADKENIPKNVKIPSSYEGLPITKIANSGFAGCKNTKNIIIPEGIEIIGDSAFYGCESIENISLPSTITNIGFGSFANCSSLKTINIPGNVSGIGGNPFIGCNALETITVNETNTDFASIENKCLIAKGTNTLITGLSNGYIPDSVTTIGNYAFLESSVAEVNIPSSVTRIGEQAFRSCPNLETVKIPNSVTRIDDSAFAECPSIKNVYITDIDSWCNTTFWDDFSSPMSNDECTKLLYVNGVRLKEIVVSDKVTSIPKSAFSNCSEITKVTFEGDDIEIIAKEAFKNCPNLKTINIPDSAIIGDMAFYNCPNLSGEMTFGGISIGMGAFSFCRNITKVTTLASVQSIHASAFDKCSGIRNVEFAEGLQTINRGAFTDCTSLVGVTIPDSVTTLDIGAFMNCHSLSNVTIGNRLNFIQDYTFTDCYNLADIVFGSAVTSIGESAFRGCSRLRKIVFPESLTTIKESAFEDCYGLVCVTLPRTLATIKADAFSRCDSLYVIFNNSAIQLTLGGGDDGYIAANAKYIETANSSSYSDPNYSFMEHLNMLVENTSSEYRIHAYIGDEDITLPAKIAGKAATPYYMKGAVNVTIEGGIQTIKSYAFESNYTITNVTTQHGTKYIESYAFWNCPNLSVLDLSRTIVSIDENAFYACKKMNVGVAEENEYFKVRDGVLFSTGKGGGVGGRVVYTNCDATLSPTATAISTGAFNCKMYLYPITIPLSCTVIEPLAFEECQNKEGGKLVVHVPYEKGNTPEGWASDWHDGSIEVVWGDIGVGDCIHEESGMIIMAPPTCTRAGRAQSTCRFCGEILISMIDPLGHDYKEIVTPPTCGDQGYTTHTCTRCGHSYKDNYVEPTGAHQYESSQHEPTCEEGGYIRHTCVVCGDQYSSNHTDPLGHIAGDWIIDTYPTYLSEGSKHKECTRCGEILETTTIPMGNPADLYLTFTLLDDGSYSVKVKDKNALPSNLVIPSKYLDLPVTKIEDSAFYACDKISTVVIPDSIITIGREAFASCDYLCKIVIPNSVKSIGYEAFYDCDNLAEVVIGRGVTSIGGYAFQDCRKLTEVTIPIGVTNMGRGVFYECGITIYCEAAPSPAGWDINWAEPVGESGDLYNTVVWNSRCLHGHTYVDGICINCHNGQRGVVYYGVSQIPDRYNSSFVLGLEHKEASSSHLTAISVEPLANEYIYYCVPTSFGDCTFTYNNFVGGFSLIVEGISITNAGGYTESYNIYKSNQSNLGVNGAITISIKGEG